MSRLKESSLAYLHTHTHAGSGEVARVGWWLLLSAKYTADDNSIILVSRLFRPLFSPSFYRWKASTFSANWPAAIWIKHWFYPKFSRCVRDDSLPLRKPRARLIAEERWKRRGWRDEDERQRGESKAERRRYLNARRETGRTQREGDNTGGWEDRTGDSPSSN